MAATTITVLAHGPIKVEGDFALVDGEGRPYATKSTIYLCRCGASANRPLCDGKHKECGFADDGAARDLTARA